MLDVVVDETAVAYRRESTSVVEFIPMLGFMGFARLVVRVSDATDCYGASAGPP
jgi:hypothetical protein